MSEKKSKTSYNPKMIRIYEEDLKKILNNTYNVEEKNVKVLNSWNHFIIFIATIIISLIIVFAFNFDIIFQNGLLYFFENDFLRCLKEYAYSSLFVALITFTIYIVYRFKK